MKAPVEKNVHTPRINHLLPFTVVTIPGSSEEQGQGSCDRDRVAVGTQPITII